MASGKHNETALAGLLDAAQGYLDQQAQLAQELKAAFFALAQARYAAGAGKLGQTQYPGAMRAAQRVHTASMEGGTHFSLREAATATQSAPEPSSSSQAQPGEFSGVLASLAEQFQCQAQLDVPGADAASPSPERRQDPLRWFGVMVPPSLRQAQQHFTAALERCTALSSQRAAVVASMAALRAPELSETSEVASTA